MSEGSNTTIPVDQPSPPITEVGEVALPTSVETPYRVCIFVAAAAQYAVDIRHIREVFPIETITPVPGMPAALLGVTNVRGSVVPVVDLRLLLRLPSSEALPPFAVVLRHDEYQVAVLVDRSPEIMMVLPEQYVDAPATQPTSPLVSGGLRIEQQVIHMFDVPRLIDYVQAEGEEQELEGAGR